MTDKIAYLTMSYDIQKTRSMAIPNCVDQIGVGDENKVLYLMYQDPFPPHIGEDHDYDIIIKEYNVEGIEGYGWWLMKLKRFLEVCKEEYFVWWDEDDYRFNSYTLRALRPVDDEHPLSWNLWNYEVKLDSIRYKKYSSGMGTLAGKVDALREPVDELLAKWPDGRLLINQKREPVDCKYKGEWTYAGGALDAYLKRILQKRYRVAEHEGVRNMSFHSKTNTRGGRKPEENIDFKCG